MVFEGEYFDGKKHGKGKLMNFETGEIFEGTWQNDMKEGKGKVINLHT